MGVLVGCGCSGQPQGHAGHGKAYKKYLEMLETQKGEIDKLTVKIKELLETEILEKGYENYVANLNVERVWSRSRNR
jgi:hypothetical protein